MCLCASLLTTVRRVITVALETCNPAGTDLLMNSDHRPKPRCFSALMYLITRAHFRSRDKDGDNTPFDPPYP